MENHKDLVAGQESGLPGGWWQLLYGSWNAYQVSALTNRHNAHCKSAVVKQTVCLRKKLTDGSLIQVGRAAVPVHHATH